MRARTGMAALAVAVTLAVMAGPAWGHGNEESTKAGDLVRQAIALIVNTPKNRMAIEDKVNDALTSKRPEGVNLELVTEAKTALGAGNLHRARALLEVAIGARPHMTSAEVLPIPQTAGPPGGAEVAGLVTGAESGTNVAADALAATLIVALGGVALAVRYRPPVSVRSLRRAAGGPREA